MAKPLRKRTALAALVAALGGPVCHADEANETDVITVRALLPEQLARIAGSAHVVEIATLKDLQPLTAKEAVRLAPGLHVIDEDAFGLKLNISVRGLNPRRSGRTLLLEDGAPIQPAPYADPSAHHAPPPSRIDRVEILKGSGQILHGPQSVGGMINFQTRPAPERAEAALGVRAGEQSLASAALRLGWGTDDFGVGFDLVETSGDGIRDGHETRVREAASKATWRPNRSHALTLKAAIYTEESRITEGGLDAARYAISPTYNPFSDDWFNLERGSAQVVHDWRIAAGATLSTQAYYADTFRASYRQADSSTDAMTANPATGCIGAARTDYEGFAGRCGNKMRPRSFVIAGLEPRLHLAYPAFGGAHATTFGFRLHREDVRRQRFNGLTPNARETSPGSLLRDDNEIETNAQAIFARHAATFGAVSIIPGLRVEQIETENHARTANFVPVDRRKSSSSTTWLPGLGVSWEVGSALALFAGVHRGFAPPRPDRDIDPNAPFSVVRPERSIDVEIGVRGSPAPGVALEATAFRLDFDDLIVEGPVVGAPSGTFANAGAARHEGLELGLRYNHRGQPGPRASLAATYLATAVFLTDAGDSAGGVKGNRLPYAPKHLTSASLGYVFANGFGARAGLTHVGAQFADARNTRSQSVNGQLGLIPKSTTYDAQLWWRPAGARFELSLAGQNVTNEVVLASRTDGMFAGPARRVHAGLKIAY